MKKVLITGGAGFIGYHLALCLLDAGYRVTLIDNFSRGVADITLDELNKNDNIEFINLDLMDEAEIRKLDDDYEYIYHLAAIIGVQNVLNHAYDVLEKNVLLLTNIIHFAERQVNLKRFIFTSTSEIYAGTLRYFTMELPTPETTPLTIPDLDEARTSYMLSKIYGEALIRQSGLPYTIVRPHNFYGPRMGMSHVIPELLKKAVNLKDGEDLEVFSVDHTRTFCYIDDAVMMMRLLAESGNALNEFYNIGNQEPEVKMSYVGECVVNTVGKNLKIKPKPVTEGSPARRCPNVEKLHQAVDYQPRFDLQTGINKTYEWYKENIFNGKTIGAR